jgi:eukaryotic-like serine/threonine-protein kinase
MPLQIGLLLNNRYRIVSTIASGGMGAIYRASDETLGISVAVKENFFTTEEFSRQFRREATILAGLRHPNLPRVTDHFVIPGTGQYLVMDFIEGSDLREIITKQGGPLPVEDVVRIGITVCDALAYLHSRNPAIVHRDIKPGNLKITPTGQVFLVDFGLAKLSHGDATTVGAQALTPGYAPPEQYGQGTEPRSDLYSLGATLYAVLTGKVPEDGLSRIMGSGDLTPIRSYNPKVPLAVAKVIEQSMLVRIEQRFQTAEEFQQELAASLPGLNPDRPVLFASAAAAAQPETIETVTQRPPNVEPGTIQGKENYQPAVLPPAEDRPVKRSWLLPAFSGVAFAVLIIGVAALILLPRIFRNQPPGGLPTEVAAVTMLATQAVLPPATNQPSLTPTLEPSATPPAPPSSTAAPEIIATSPADPTSTQEPAATPAGGGPGQFAIASDRGGSFQIWLIGLDGSSEQITKIPDGACQPSWSPDGKKLVFISPCSGVKEDYPGSSLYTINADGTGLVPLASMPGGDFDPAWSPDGMQIAFTTLRDNGVPHIYLYLLADNTVVRLSRVVNYERQPAWSADGTRLAYQTTRLGQPQVWVMDANGENAHEFSSLAGSFEWKPDWSPDGSILVYSQGTPSQLVARQVEDKQAKEFPISDKIRPAEGADFSPDGWWLAFESKQEDNLDVYIMLKNGTNLTRLTDQPGVDNHPAWRPFVQP